ncbi:hypothetical protein [Aliiglaciecola lipolytica]|uniref:hypothetical protein n=1 Tax=Aliiglaciecola lipolytica TaxID=477689 RepID=UPI001C0A1DF0|nr:hypothetical protein [Aliiglaciecola lipolytica]MBU2877058.1 hypothetical protein [Aliiglaciecola lipolytica]
MKAQNPEVTEIVGIVSRLFEKWELNENQKTALINESTPSELHMRLSLLLNIHEELRMIFENPENIYGYMRMINHNSPFNGSRPIDLACKNIEGLQHTYNAICGITGSANHHLA